MLSWRYFALVLSSGTIFGLAVYVAGCGRDRGDVIGIDKGKCIATETTTCDCQTDQDCGSDFCNIAACVERKCQLIENSEQDGQALPEEDQEANDCNVKVCMQGTAVNQPDPSDICNKGACTPAGECVECNGDMDCANGGYCHQGICASCSDQTKNGDELDIDCGNIKCGLCNGAACSGDSKLCHSGVCADGVCCESDCMATCMACNLPGNLGTCFQVPAGDIDIGTCGTDVGGSTGCGMAGDCIPNMKKANEGTCAGDDKCLSGKCTNIDIGGTGVCKQNAGPCSTNEECASGMCVTSNCVPL